MARLARPDPQKLQLEPTQALGVNSSFTHPLQPPLGVVHVTVGIRRPLTVCGGSDSQDHMDQKVIVAGNP